MKNDLKAISIIFKVTLTMISANKIDYLYENLDRTFKELTWEMKHFAAKDPNTHKVY